MHERPKPELDVNLLQIWDSLPKTAAAATAVQNKKKMSAVWCRNRISRLLIKVQSHNVNWKQRLFAAEGPQGPPPETTQIPEQVKHYKPL